MSREPVFCSRVREKGVGLPVVYIIISVIVIIAAVILIGALSRRMIYKQIDKLESWKIDIMNRPITNEISKVKRLKMYGETEERFESWRTEWDDIVTVELPEVEEKLFEAEEHADKFRFRQAKLTVEDIHNTLEHAERRIEGLLKDLDLLISSEEKNREDIVSVKSDYHEVKKQLLTQRRHYQKAIIPIEKALHDIELSFERYDKQTEEGNYLEARNTLLETRKGLDSLNITIEAVPGLYSELQTNLPEQIKELRDGYQEMADQGYVLDHIMIENELKEFEKKIASLIAEVEQVKIENHIEEITKIQERIDMLYDQLSQEVDSRKFVNEEVPVMKNRIVETGADISKLKGETEVVQLSYRIEQEDLEIQEQLEKELGQLKKRFADTEEAINDQKQAFTMLQDKLKTMKERLDLLEAKREQYQEMLSALRKDELKAKETLDMLRKRLVEAKRMVQKSNLPGVPHTHLTGLASAEEKIEEVEEKLAEKPLEMSVVNRILEEALTEVEESFARTKKLIEDAELAERLIQYGNRYRSRHEQLRNKLTEAEGSFRNYSYEEALELAAEAVQYVEPDILKKFDVTFETEEI